MQRNLGAKIDAGRVKMNAKASRALPDVCSFSKPGTSARHGYGYTTDGSPTTLSSVPCELEPLSSYEMLVGGQTTAGANGKLKVPANSSTLLIGGEQTGTIAARGTSPAVDFTVVGPLRSSTNIWLYLAVTV